MRYLRNRKNISMHLGRVDRVDGRWLNSFVVVNFWTTILECNWGFTRKMGCFNANFSTPPLIMLVLNVMIPASTGLSISTITFRIRRTADHFNGTAGQHLSLLLFISLGLGKHEV